MYENKKILILGMARSGYEVAKFLSNYHNEIVVTDCKEQDASHVDELKKIGISVVITDNPNELLDESFDAVVKNPGIKYTHPTVIKAHELKIPVVNELEVSYHFLDPDVSIIGVTGSNGKTTTVTLIYEFLKTEKENVYLCGNIGYPVSSMVGKVKKNDIMVIEISDHQLCDMYDFKTDVSVLTNISETHIDFHDSYERYKQMKKRIFNNHGKEDIAVLNLDNEEVLNLTRDIPSTKYYFSREKEEKCYLKDGIIYYDGKKVVSTADICIKGNHNYENIMAAIIVAKHFNISDESILKVLSEFKGVEHRIEYVTTIEERKFYNDSKSTNNKATMTALSSFDDPTILLMGGLDRGIPFDSLKPYLTHVKRIECFGETKDKIKEFALSNQIDCEVFDTMEPAIMDAYQHSDKGDVILLSPACASWDQYKCFEDRGEEFKKIVYSLK